MKQTFFASPDRAPAAKIKSDFALLCNSEYINTVINALPEVVAILNKERQIIFGNEVLIKFLGFESTKEFLGLRVGEAVKCVNAGIMEGGCGTSKKCRYCGAINSILESQLNMQKVSKDCRIITERNGVNEFLDLRITSSPFNFQNNSYTILTIDDISDAKRRNMLERVFFHDIINLAGGLKGVADILTETPGSEQNTEYIGLVKNLSQELLEEIMSQRALLFAEKDELHPDYRSISSLRLLEETVSYLSHHPVAQTKHLLIDANAANTTLITDPVLLKRVLVNMLKNALEASADGADVKLTCQVEPDFVVFKVHNQGFMPANVQAQVFERSFSTKGEGRGLGTYSIKLFTERYLKGTTGFTSSSDKGTEFFVRIPLSI